MLEVEQEVLDEADELPGIRLETDGTRTPVGRATPETTGFGEGSEYGGVCGVDLGIELLLVEVTMVVEQELVAGVTGTEGTTGLTLIPELIGTTEETGTPGLLIGVAGSLGVLSAGFFGDSGVLSLGLDGVLVPGVGETTTGTVGFGFVTPGVELTGVFGEGLPEPSFGGLTTGGRVGAGLCGGLQSNSIL